MSSTDKQKLHSSNPLWSVGPGSDLQEPTDLMYHEYNLTKMEIPRRLTEGLDGFPLVSITWSILDMFRNPHVAFFPVTRKKSIFQCRGSSRYVTGQIGHPQETSCEIVSFQCSITYGLGALMGTTVLIGLLVYYLFLYSKHHDSFASTEDCI